MFAHDQGKRPFLNHLLGFSPHFWAIKLSRAGLEIEVLSLCEALLTAVQSTYEEGGQFDIHSWMATECTYRSYRRAQGVNLVESEVIACGRALAFSYLSKLLGMPYSPKWFLDNTLDVDFQTLPDTTEINLAITALESDLEELAEAAEASLALGLWNADVLHL